VVGMGPDDGDTDPDGQSTLSPEEALCALACHSMYADGTVTLEEDETLRAYLETVGAFRRRGRTVQDALAKVNRLARREGEDALLARAVAALPETMRPAAYFAVVDLVLSDRDLSPDEEEYLAHIQGLLGLSDDLADQMLEVAVLKNAA
jgi:uncharacterized tellurite resistance protein B-like protein